MNGKVNLPSPSNVRSNAAFVFSRTSAAELLPKSPSVPATTTRPSPWRATATAVSGTPGPDRGINTRPSAPNVVSNDPSGFSRATKRDGASNPVYASPTITNLPSGWAARPCAWSSVPHPSGSVGLRSNAINRRPSPSNVGSSDPSGFSRATATSSPVGPSVSALPARTIRPSGSTTIASAFAPPIDEFGANVTIARPSSPKFVSSEPSGFRRTTTIDLGMPSDASQICPAIRIFPSGRTAVACAFTSMELNDPGG
jgi:hypothetical protein